MKLHKITCVNMWTAAVQYNICIMTMHTACVYFIETLNPELKPPPCIAITSKRYKLVEGWLFLGSICEITNSNLLWSTEPPRRSPTCGLHLLNYPVFFCFFLWLTDQPTKASVSQWMLHFAPFTSETKQQDPSSESNGNTFLIIAAIIIMLVLQQCLSVRCGPTASWMGT